ncbi:MAG: hypothetical protein UV73_C0005G0010 [Candidatus Gottesmanbacteria bacterium GW2011_GWA2_43_14]|uniref:YYY membrane protein n=1 Tax=Candidatus Gottesmanbacteria bacterium GW2011_GWA2_43_14 TaxID=1618443 RepID=A0A0G1GFY0_9BACT|nr:MAG: hypothetical protein UV73_C0005G0010 [Candidatus Gottesmanbacteria bacterium GW2011_GWA2_43_14]
MSDLSAILVWWLTFLIVGTIFLPLTLTLFKRFADRGYIFSKVLGILFTSYIIWLFGSLHLLPFIKISLFLILLLMAIVNLIIYGRNKESSGYWPWKWMIIEEIFFLAAIVFWSFVRGNEPSIRGLEKFMDYGFVNSILKSAYFPPLDIWLTKSPEYSGGYFINYYYFGHYITAFLTKLSGIDSAVTYNLMMNTLFAFTFTLSFCLGLNLYYLFLAAKPLVNKGRKFMSRGQNIKLFIAGILAAFIVSMGGNLHTIYVFTSGYPNESPKPFWQIPLGFYPERYWYPNATRFIPNTIHEFPIYSFVVADLHGHVSDIPFVLLTLALLLHLVTAPIGKNKEGENGSRPFSLTRLAEDIRQHTYIPLPYLILLGLLIAVMYMTNAWDGLIYLVLTGLVFLYLNFKNGENRSVFSIFYKTGSASLFLLFFFLLANFPFMISFKPFASGIGVLCAPKFLLEKKLGPFLFETGKCQKSALWMMSLLWGFFYYSVAGYLVFVISNKYKLFLNETSKLKSGIRSLKQRFLFTFKNRFSQFFPFLRLLSPIDAFVLMMILISTLLLIFPEFFYIKDIYPAHYRANTMFKLGYQAFMMLGISSAFIIFRIREYAAKYILGFTYTLYNTLFIFFFTLIAIYPYFAINSYYGQLKQYKGQNGLVWMLEQFPDDYRAIEWLRQNAGCSANPVVGCQSQPVIAEAVGESYTDYSRVSSYTGLPTVVGWPVHEWLWRGSYDEAGKRIPEVETLYQTVNTEEAGTIITKYNIDYVFVGSLEREKYPQLSEDKFSQIGRVVFESGATRVYKIDRSAI